MGGTVPGLYESHGEQACWETDHSKTFSEVLIKYKWNFGSLSLPRGRSDKGRNLVFPTEGQWFSPKAAVPDSLPTLFSSLSADFSPFLNLHKHKSPAYARPPYSSFLSSLSPHP